MRPPSHQHKGAQMNNRSTSIDYENLGSQGELPTESVELVEDSEAGLTTAELLGNAALGIAALVLIWAGLQALGLDIVDWIRSQVLR